MKYLAHILIACTIVEAIQNIRPGAQWTVRDGTLDWLDPIQTKPTASEIQTAISACQVSTANRAIAKAQAKQDVKNGSLTVAQRFQALLILTDNDQ